MCHCFAYRLLPAQWYYSIVVIVQCPSYVVNNVFIMLCIGETPLTLHLFGLWGQFNNNERFQLV